VTDEQFEAYLKQVNGMAPAGQFPEMPCAGCGKMIGKGGTEEAMVMIEDVPEPLWFHLYCEPIEEIRA